MWGPPVPPHQEGTGVEMEAEEPFLLRGAQAEPPRMGAQERALAIPGWGDVPDVTSRAGRSP